MSKPTVSATGHAVEDALCARLLGLPFDEGRSPYIVGIGGTTRERSSSELALRYALEAARDLGAETEMFGAAALDLPLYREDRRFRSPAAARLVNALARADGVIVSSPGYHGGISGLVKNALDYIEDLRDHRPPYLEDRAVGCIVTAYGWQASTTTLVSLRSTVHALRGWPTPLGVVINSAQVTFDERGTVADDRCAVQLRTLSAQVLRFSMSRVGRALTCSAEPNLTEKVP